jgi:hypothetical protein
MELALQTPMEGEADMVAANLQDSKRTSSGKSDAGSPHLLFFYAIDL